MNFYDKVTNVLKNIMYNGPDYKYISNILGPATRAEQLEKSENVLNKNDDLQK